MVVQVSNRFTMGKATQAGRLFSARTKERSSRNVKMPLLVLVSGVSRTHISPVGLGRLSFFRIMHLQKHTVGGDYMVIPLLGYTHLLFESYMAYTHSIETKQLSELSLQRVSRLLLVPRLLCARLIE